MSHKPNQYTIPNNAIYIIDGIACAFAVSILCRGKSIHCIFEVKKITWRKNNIVEMYKMILHDVHLLSAEIVHVEALHWFGHQLGFVERQRRKIGYFMGVRRRVNFPRKAILISTSNSTILRAYRFFREYMLIDEGMSSLITRNIPDQLDFVARVKRFIFHVPRAMGLDKELSRSNITLTADESIEIGCRVNFRNFESEPLRRRYFNDKDSLEKKNKSVLVLVAGPPHLSPYPISWEDQPTEAYLDFNVREISRFLKLYPEFKDCNLYLKTHPTLGVKNALLSTLPKLLVKESIKSSSMYGDSNDLFQASIPSEAFLSVGEFSALLAIDVSSTVWNVCHHDRISCFMPYKSLLRFQVSHCDARQYALYEHQARLNEICGDNVVFF